MIRRQSLIYIAIIFILLLLSGCTRSEIVNEQGGDSIPSPERVQSEITLRPSVEITPIPTINRAFENFHASIFIDKTAVERGDYIVIMGKIWAPYEGKAPDFKGPQNVSITLLMDNRPLLSKTIPLLTSLQAKEVSKYFTRKIDTSQLNPGSYEVAAHFNTGHYLITQFLVEPENTESRTCGSIICDYREKCCNGSCYNPADGVCVNGTVSWASCGEKAVEESIFDYKNEGCRKELRCPEGQTVYPLVVGCWDPGLCPEDARIGYTKYECAKVVKTATGWCNYSEIYCGQCLPQYTSNDRMLFCGYQWTIDDIRTAPEL